MYYGKGSIETGDARKTLVKSAENCFDVKRILGNVFEIHR